MHTWKQSVGEWSFPPKPTDGSIVVAQGYSGGGRGKNRPDYQSVADVGPIPQGNWTITALTVEETDHGPYVLHLAPCENTNTFGREGFLIHGDSLEHPGEASKGCIILPRSIRERIWQSNDRSVQVIG